MTPDNFCFYLQNITIQTSQTGGQRCRDTSPFNIPCSSPLQTLVNYGRKKFYETETRWISLKRKTSRLTTWSSLMTIGSWLVQSFGIQTSSFRLYQSFFRFSGQLSDGGTASTANENSEKFGTEISRLVRLAICWGQCCKTCFFRQTDFKQQ